MITRLEIDGMSSQYCVRAVFTALTPVPGIVRVEIGIGWAVVEHDGSATSALLREAIAVSGKTALRAVEERSGLPIVSARS